MRRPDHYGMFCLEPWHAHGDTLVLGTMDLTPEERRRIFAEEIVRGEARARMEEDREEQLHETRRAKRRKLVKWLLLLSAPLTVIALLTTWRIWLMRANETLIVTLHRAETNAGSTPSDDEWRNIHGVAAVAGINRDHREAAALYIKSLQYAATNERAAGSYQALGLEFEELDLLGEAEHCHRRAVSLAPDDDFGWRCLADVLDKRKKYAEAESIYRDLVQRASTTDAKHTAVCGLWGVLKDMGRKPDADKYFDECLKLLHELVKK